MDPARLDWRTVKDHTNAGDRWIPEPDYQRICSLVPILSVDLLPVLRFTRTFGLIERDTYAGGRGLNLVGGAVLLDEPLLAAVARHVAATLGDEAGLQVDSLRLFGIYPYHRKARPGQPHDPRKHAVSLTYTGMLQGEVRPMGEAHAFHTFDIDAPPPPEAFGFGQGSVVYDGLAALRASMDLRG